MSFKFRYFYDTIGIVGASRSGKSHITRQLGRMAGGRCSAITPWPRMGTQYKEISKDVVVPKYNELNGATIDDFLVKRKDWRYWLCVLDDIDTFIKYYNDSKLLGDLPIASKGHWNHGNIFQARRTTNLPYTLIQNSTYMIFTYGVDKHDYKDLEKYAGLDLNLYAKIPIPTRNKRDPSIVDYCEYLLLNTETGEQQIISGFD